MSDTPLEELVAKLDAATEGSRELDVQIWELVDFRAALRRYWSAATGKRVKLHSLPESGLGWLAVKNSAPHYTTSIDAALTLVPEGWGWNATGEHSTGFVLLYPPNNYPGATGVQAEAPTPALAICIAALRARA